MCASDCRMGVSCSVDVSLDWSAGTTTALLGRSGSGKTTLLRMVNGLVTADSGEVRVAGRRSGGGRPVGLRRGIGYVIQETGLFPHMTVERNVGMALELAGQSREERRRGSTRCSDWWGWRQGDFGSGIRGS